VHVAPDLPDTPDELSDPDNDPGGSFEQYDDNDERIDIERPHGVEHFGTTATEQLEGESLDDKLAEELPDGAVDGDFADDEPAEIAALNLDERS